MTQVLNTVLGITEDFDALKMAWFREGNVMHRRYNVGAKSRDIGVIMLEDEAWEMPRLHAVDWDPELESEGGDDADDPTENEFANDIDREQIARDADARGADRDLEIASRADFEDDDDVIGAIDRDLDGEIGRTERERQAVERHRAAN